MKKALSLALALALCMGLFSGCGTETGSNSTSQPAQSSGETVKTVTWASTSDITGLDPRNGNSTITASILASLYSTLVKTDPQGQIVCDAAESYEQVDDTTWHFTLRQDVYFTNGTQMTADDVAYTINSLRDSRSTTLCPAISPSCRWRYWATSSSTSSLTTLSPLSPCA